MSDPTPIRTIDVVEYDPLWQDEFRSYYLVLRAVLGELIMSIEHIGSTSVIGLAAKPIVDMVIVISSRIQLKPVIDKLSERDYIHEGNLGIPGREAFMWPKGKRHHLYVCSVDTPNLHNYLIFRDYLRAHPDAVEAYSSLKRRLAKEYRNDMDGYGAAKTEFIQSTIARAIETYGFDRFQ